MAFGADVDIAVDHESSSFVPLKLIVLIRLECVDSNGSVYEPYGVLWADEPSDANDIERCTPNRFVRLKPDDASSIGSRARRLPLIQIASDLVVVIVLYFVWICYFDIYVKLEKIL